MGMIIGDKDSYNEENFSMTPKQKAIKEAYGEYWEKVKNNVSNNGWIDTCFFSLRDSGIKYIQSKNYDGLALIFLHRPLLLEGIENNNGWIKIENNIVENLIDGETYHTYEKNVANQRKLVYSEKSHGFLFMGFKQWCTHYQPIIKPQPPIY